MTLCIHLFTQFLILVSCPYILIITVEDYSDSDVAYESTPAIALPDVAYESSLPTALPDYSQAPITGIPVVQPNRPPLAHQVPSRVAWSTGLCTCFSDIPNCCITCFCPCKTFGKIAEIADRGSTSCGKAACIYTLIACCLRCPCIYSCFYRTKMIKQFMLADGPCPDCLVHCFCENCALCQEYRELQNRGFDMSLGWHGNVEKHNQGGLEYVITTLPHWFHVFA